MTRTSPYGLTVPIVAAMSLLAACTPAQNQQALVSGQLFCLMASSGSVVALADASGAPVLAVDQAKAVVDRACDLVGGLAVSPPPATVVVPVMAVAR